MLRPVAAFARRPFVRNVVTVAGGTAVAQAVALIFYPVVTRIYGPEALGILGVFMSTVAILAPLAAFSYPIAIVLPKSDADAKSLIRLSILIAVSAAVAAALLLAAFFDPIIELFHLQKIAPFVFLLPVAMLFVAMQDIAQQWLIRTKQFSLTASVAALHATIINAAKAGFGLVHPLASTLILISAAGFALQAGMLALGSRWTGRQRNALHSGEPEKNLTAVARLYSDFPMFRAPQDLLNALSQGLPVILLATFYGPAVAGFFTLAISVLTAPVSLIGNAVGNVLYPRLAEAASRGEDLRRLVVGPTCIMLIIGLVPFGTMMVFGPPLFAWIFGEDWREAGECARWLAIWTLFGFANIPSIKVIPVVGAQKSLLLFGISSLIARTISVVLPYHMSDPSIHAIIYISLSGSLLNAALIIITSYKFK